MAKAILDRSCAVVGLVLTAPLLLVVALFVWLQDFKSPLYVAPRVAKGGGTFQMVKLRSMIANADQVGGSSTSGDDARITAVGRFIRRWKIDELSQLWNVLIGDMSLVGPRPQVIAEAASYTEEERGLLEVKPGITDFSSIVFADEGDILQGATDPDLAYNQLIRPWKSRLGLLYVERRTFFIDLRLIELTLIRILAPARALRGVCRLLEQLGASEEILRVASRSSPLLPGIIPGRTRPFGL